MKVSLVTICYNSESTIRDTIESVLSQDYSEIEYIIKDGGSTDNTIKIIEEYSSRITKVVSCKDAGIYDAINQGVALTTGDVVGLIHADDILGDESAVSIIVKSFKNSGCDAVYGDLEYVDKDNTSKVVRCWKSGVYEIGDFLRGWMPPHPTFYVKKSVYDKYGLYDSSFKSAGDYELMLRYIHKENIKLMYIPHVLVKMRVGGKSNASFANRIKANLEDRRAWRINEISPRLFTLIQKPLRKIKQFF
jgi:glycosyltransferase involved in cell wall biosynthesis